MFFQKDGSSFLKTFTAISLSVFLSSCTSGQSFEDRNYIPMDFSAGRPTVKVKINDKGPYPFVFDTGAPEGVIDSKLAEELKLTVVDTVEIGDGISIQKAERVIIPDLSMGESQFPNVVMDKFELGGRFCSIVVLSESSVCPYFRTICSPLIIPINKSVSIRVTLKRRCQTLLSI